MRLIKNPIQQFDHTERRYRRLKEIFAAFVQATTAFFSDPDSPVKGITISVSEHGDHFDATFASIQVRFHFLASYAANENLVGKVVCVLESPAFTDMKEIIGTFTFNGQGIADFEVPPGADEIEIAYAAVDIVLHFLDQAMHR